MRLSFINTLEFHTRSKKKLVLSQKPTIFCFGVSVVDDNSSNSVLPVFESSSTTRTSSGCKTRS